MKMEKQEKKTKFITKDILKTSIIGAFQKLNPKYISETGSALHDKKSGHVCR